VTLQDLALSACGIVTSTKAECPAANLQRALAAQRINTAYRQLDPLDMAGAARFRAARLGALQTTTRDLSASVFDAVKGF